MDDLNNVSLHELNGALQRLDTQHPAVRIAGKGKKKKKSGKLWGNLGTVWGHLAFIIMDVATQVQYVLVFEFKY